MSYQLCPQMRHLLPRILEPIAPEKFNVVSALAPLYHGRRVCHGGLTLPLELLLRNLPRDSAVRLTTFVLCGLGSKRYFVSAKALVKYGEILVRKGIKPLHFARTLYVYYLQGMPIFLILDTWGICDATKTYLEKAIQLLSGKKFRIETKETAQTVTVEANEELLYEWKEADRGIRFYLAVSKEFFHVPKNVYEHIPALVRFVFNRQPTRARSPLKKTLNVLRQKIISQKGSIVGSTLLRMLIDQIRVSKKRYHPQSALFSLSLMDIENSYIDPFLFTRRGWPSLAPVLSQFPREYKKCLNLFELNSRALTLSTYKRASFSVAKRLYTTALAELSILYAISCLEANPIIENHFDVARVIRTINANATTKLSQYLGHMGYICGGTFTQIRRGRVVYLTWRPEITPLKHKAIFQRTHNASPYVKALGNILEFDMKPIIFALLEDITGKTSAAIITTLNQILALNTMGISVNPDINDPYKSKFELAKQYLTEKFNWRA